MSDDREPLDELDELGELDEVDADALAEGTITPEDARVADPVVDEDPGEDSERPVVLEEPEEGLDVEESLDPRDA